ncbi:MAG TPA: hypothetical protein VFM25_11450 [Verrucomicrobiae bacterium]|nr:hypothetical protein [Verrucomicrobiae bacterium]
MKIKNNSQTKFRTLTVAAIALCFAGCATTKQNSGASAKKSHFPKRYVSTDGRDVRIGKSVAADGGWVFREPHMNNCWIATNFNFNGYDTLYIAPTLSTATFHDDEARPHELAKENLVIELNRELGSKNIFPKIVTDDSQIPPGAHALKLENTIVEYSKGGGAARYWVGLYGGGQPVLRVRGKMTDGDQTVFTYEARRSGVSAGARTIGAFMKDEDIQLEDIRSMSLDLSDFMAAIAGKYPAKN